MKCPGQDTRYWKPGSIFTVPCPACGRDVEFFKDETSRRCRQCGEKVVNPKMDFACAVHCRYARQCLGELPPELVAQRNDLLKDRLANEMKRFLHGDFKRIRHANRVARYAQELVHEEKGDSAVVAAAAYLHNLGLGSVRADDPNAEAGGVSQSGVAAARQILENLGAEKELIHTACEIIGHLNESRIDEAINFKVVHDADLIARLEEEGDKSSRPGHCNSLGAGRSFMTKAGRELARRLLPQGEAQ